MQSTLKERRFRSAPAVWMTLLVLLAVSPAAYSQSDAVSTMAGILLEMTHFPTEEHKETLAAISEDDDASEASRTIAEAIRNIEHKAQPEDVDELQKVAAGFSGSMAEQQLANIVLDFEHKASAEARDTLEALAQP